MRVKRVPTGFIIPAQPVTVTRPPSGEGWIHEIKHDGYRLIVRRAGGEVRLFTRSGLEWSARFPLIAAAAAGLAATSFTIDGEAVVCRSDGIAVFDRLRRVRQVRKRIVASPEPDGAFLYAFDLLEIGGHDIRHKALAERKTMLAALLRDAAPGLQLNGHIAGDGAVVFEHACRLGAEGIVSKRVDSRYSSGRCPAWVKIKNPASPAVARERRAFRW